MPYNSIFLYRFREEIVVILSSSSLAPFFFPTSLRTSLAFYIISPRYNLPRLIMLLFYVRLCTSFKVQTYWLSASYILHFLRIFLYIRMYNVCVVQYMYECMCVHIVVFLFYLTRAVHKHVCECFALSFSSTSTFCTLIKEFIYILSS